MTFKTNLSTLVLVPLFALPSLALLACGGDDPTIISRPSNGGSGAEPSGSAGTGGSNTGAGGTSAAGTNAGGTSAEAACVESPATPDEFLRRCTDSACRPFDNALRLSLYRPGEPLPEVP